MSTALIGHTGFVGGNLQRQREFTDTYHSKNIQQIRGKKHQLLVISGAPAVKWLANREPEKDIANLQQLMGHLEQTQADFAVLISTVDVYPNPCDVDEDSPIDVSQQHAYGRHRLQLEQFVQQHFPETLIVRLPGLFGPGLKKNAIYDFLHENQTENIHCDALYQFYNLDHLWRDIARIREQGLSLVNLATEPISIADMTREVFEFDFSNRPTNQHARYDFRSKHDGILGGSDGYLYNRAAVINDLKSFVAQQRATVQ